MVLLTGARQVGKSTLAQELIGKYWNALYLTLDDRAVLDAALRDPDGFVSGTPTPVVFDEKMNYPAASCGVSLVMPDLIRHPGCFFLDSGLRRNDNKRGKPRGMNPERFKRRPMSCER